MVPYLPLLPNAKQLPLWLLYIGFHCSGEPCQMERSCFISTGALTDILTSRRVVKWRRYSRQSQFEVSFVSSWCQIRLLSSPHSKPQVFVTLWYLRHSNYVSLIWGEIGTVQDKDWGEPLKWTHLGSFRRQIHNPGRWGKTWASYSGEELWSLIMSSQNSIIQTRLQLFTHGHLLLLGVTRQAIVHITVN